MTAEQMIDYEALAQEAMRGVVRAVLTQTAKSGLPGDHHFYISFDTEMPGVGLSKRLKAKYPTEMTVVLQHRFWDLNITDDRFEVKLTFDGIPERLVVPFASIKVFFDPSVRYGLQFDEPEFNADMVDASMTSLEHGLDGSAEDAEFATDADAETVPTISRSSSPRKRPAAKHKFEQHASDNSQSDEIDETTADHADDTAVEVDNDADNEEDEHIGGAEIVSLDAFRKK